MRANCVDYFNSIHEYMQFCSRYKQEDVLLCRCQPTNTRYRYYSLKDACIAANLTEKNASCYRATNFNNMLFDKRSSYLLDVESHVNHTALLYAVQL